MALHKTQQTLLKLSQSTDLSQLSLREIAKMADVRNPQTIKFHLNKLIKMGYLKQNLSKGPFESLKKSYETGKTMIDLPILGQANCGFPNFLAEEYMRGFLKVSKSLVRDPKDKFALEAKGNSMNRANINGKSIEDGDFVIVDSKYNAPVDGDYVLSIIDGKANIKRFHYEKNEKAIYLMSESSESFPPIIISKLDYTPYFVNGKIVAVLKKPRE